MSDRQRRWICRLMFALVCVLPTLWSLVRVRCQPTPTQWSRELQVSLGLPFDIEVVETPNASTIRLKKLVWNHPELGKVAEINQIAIQQRQVGNGKPLNQDQVLPSQVWKIDQLKVYELSLDEFLATLHQQWLRQHRGSSLPEIHIAELFVYCEPSRRNEVGQSLVLRLQDLVVRNEAEHSADPRRISTGPSVSVLGSIMPLSLPPLMNGRSPKENGVPFAFRVGRANSGSGSLAYITNWLLTLDRSLPVNYVNLDVVPSVMQDASFQVQGKFFGTTNDRQWNCQLEDVFLTGPAVRDGKFLLSHLARWIGGETAQGKIQGEATLRVDSAYFRGLNYSQPELVALEAVLRAEDGSIENGFLRNLRTAFNAEANLENLAPAKTVFDRLGVRLSVRGSFLQLRPVSESIKDYTLISSDNQLWFIPNNTPFDLRHLKQQMGTAESSNAWNQLNRLVPDSSNVFEGKPVQQANFIQP